ncbi:DedA family protein [Sinomonas humi]|uniref:Alkaline phosphatase n=1 Tax=Sinomonas humi TaxID=1338436 RepID=A0A0B2AMC6_9MICC|nr:VTT domain-containing protein [Sinomonas humi]KHL02910.1 alkaline phosphatase [Sinomonas humi]
MPDLTSLLSGSGPWLIAIVAVIMFIESGLLFPFLPGDTLLFSLGVLGPHLPLPLPVLVLVAAVAAIAGNEVGYLIGKAVGRRWFREDARILKLKHLESAETFFARYGGRALALARFVPVARTYTPLVAGAARYPRKKFLGWNVLGAIAWTVAVALVGMWLGKVDFIAKNIDILATLLVLVSVAPLGIEALRRRAKARREPVPVPVESDVD